MKQKKSKNLSDNENKEIYNHLVKLVRTLDNKEKYKYHDCDDLNYHGIRDIESLFDNVNDIIINQYQSKLLSTKTISIMKAEVIKTKNYQQNNILT